MDKIVDTIKPNVELEKINCCLSTCCMRKKIYNFVKSMTKKTTSFVRRVTD